VATISVGRETELGLYAPETLHLTVEARKEAVKQLADQGMSNRQIAKVVGASPATIGRDLGVSNETEGVSNETPPNDPEPQPAEPSPDPDQGELPDNGSSSWLAFAMATERRLRVRLDLDRRPAENMAMSVKMYPFEWIH
jgi:hypothetical protein